MMKLPGTAYHGNQAAWIFSVPSQGKHPEHKYHLMGSVKENHLSEVSTMKAMAEKLL